MWCWLPRSVVALVLVAQAAFLTPVFDDYTRVERDLFAYRMRMARIGDLSPPPSPDMRVLQPLQATLESFRAEPRRGMSSDETTWVNLATTASLQFSLDRHKLRQARRREGRYLLRTDLTAYETDALWTFYIQLTEVEQAFKEIKHDLAIRPIFHRTEERIEAHIFVAFLAYCLQVTLKTKMRVLAGGTTPREVLGKFKTMQMVDVHLPTTDGRELTLSRYTQPEAEHRMLLDQLRLSLPDQPPPKIAAAQAKQATAQLAL